MILQLTEEYIPEKILHRQDQIGKIREVFRNFKKSGMAENLVILGVTGSGKTTIVKKVIEDENNSIYINCNEHKTTFRILQSICGAKVKTQAEILGKTIEYLKENPRVIILDEVDKASNILSLMNDLNTIWRKLMIPIIIITPRRTIMNLIPTDVKKTLWFNRISLSSYNSAELLDILNERLSMIDLDLRFLDEGKKSFICAIASQQGSARVLMNILIRCIQSNNFSQTFIKEIYNNMIKEDWLGFIDELNETEKKFVKVALGECNDENWVSSESLQKKMNLSAGRISQIVGTLERYDVIISKHENKGRAGGRRRFIKFSSKDAYNTINKEIGYGKYE